MMFTKKFVPALLTAAIFLSSANAAAPKMTACAKDRITFYTGAAYDKDFGVPTQKINAVKVPQGCTCTINSPDVSATDDSLTAANTKIADISFLHKNMGWVIHAKKAGKTTLRYKKGSDTGRLNVEILPALKLTALKKSAKVRNGKLRLTVKYKNNTDTAITIEGIDIGRAQVLFEGEKTPSKEAVIPSRWIAKKVTIPAGKTKNVTVTEPVSQTGKIKKFDYPPVYLKYHDVYFTTTIDREKAADGVFYHGTKTFREYQK